MEETDKEGWAWVFTVKSLEAHYFVDKKSLCGKWKWSYTGSVSKQERISSENQCKECKDF